MTENQTARIPSKGWYLLPVAFFVAGVAASLYVLISSINSFETEYQAVAPQGETRVQLTGPRSYTIFVEITQTVRSRSVSVPMPGSGHTTFTAKDAVNTKDLPALLQNVTITSPSGKPVELLLSAAEQSYNVNDRHGRAKYMFLANENGFYRFLPTFDPKADLSVISLRVTPSGFGNFQKTFLAIFGFYFSSVIAVVMAIYIFLKREASTVAAAGKLVPELTRDRKVAAVLITLFFFSGTGSMLIGETFLSIVQLGLIIGGVVLASTVTLVGILTGFTMALTGAIWGIVTVVSAKAKVEELPPVLANRPPRTPRT